MSKTSYLLCSVVAIAVVVAVLAPARALTPFMERIDGLTLRDVSGRWWRGEANLAVRDFPVGRWSWRLDPWPLLVAELAMYWRLVDADHRLAGSAAVDFGGTTSVTASGQAGVAAINRLLAAYRIQLDGAFQIERLSARIEDEEFAAAGTLRWDGGRTVYHLSGRSYEAHMPPMVAQLETDAGKPTLTVRSASDQTRLLEAVLDAEGWLRLGVTKRLTVLAGKPWLGAAEDEDIVLSVEEKVVL